MAASKRAGPHEIREIDGVEYVLVPRQKWDDLGTYFEIALEEELEQRDMQIVEREKLEELEVNKVSFWLLTFDHVIGAVFMLGAAVIFASGLFKLGFDPSKWKWTGVAWLHVVFAGTLLISLMGNYVGRYFLRPGFNYRSLQAFCALIFDAPFWICFAFWLNIHFSFMDWVWLKFITVFGPLR